MARSDTRKNFKDWVLQPFKKESKSVWRVFVLCFFTASIFWVFNSLNKTYVTVVNFPLEIDYDEENFIPLDELPTSAKMEVNGFGWDLLKWSFGFGLNPLPMVPLDYENNTLNLNDYKTDIVEHFGQVNLNTFVNDTLFLNFDKKTQRQLKLVIDTASLRLGKEFRLSSPILITPDSINLTGPKSILDNMKDVFYVKLPDKKVNANFDEEIELNFKSNPLVSLDRMSVNVFFGVEEMATKEINKVIVKKNFPSDTIKTLPSSVNCTIVASKNNIEKIDTDSIEVIADFRRFNKKDSTIQLSTDYTNALIHEFKLSPDTVKVRY